jgi:hypothetical protein
MEGSMDGETNKQNKLPRKPQLSNAADANGPDAMGFWFAAVVLCAVLVAGVIIYRIGNPDIVTASNEVTPATVHGNAH